MHSFLDKNNNMKGDAKMDQAQNTTQIRKQLLDISLELIAIAQDMDNTMDLQKRLEKLQKSLEQSVNVEVRPTTILVTGFSPDECNALLDHFKVSFSYSCWIQKEDRFIFYVVCK